MNTKVRTMVFKRKQFQEFLSNAKNTLIKRGGSTRIDEIELVKSSGNFTPGTLINTPDFKSNNDTQAEKYCSYIINKKVNIITETGIDEYLQILIYQGNDIGKEIKTKYGLTKDMEVELFKDIKLFYNAVKDYNIKYMSIDKDYSITITNKILRQSSGNLNIGLRCSNWTLSTTGNVESSISNVNTDGYGITDVVIIEQTKVFNDSDKSTSKIKYLILELN